MREIIFRGKGIHTGKWFFGSLVEAEKLDNSKRMEFFIIEKSADGATHAVKPETVGQYTGLKDKNGKPIFEGDTLRRQVVDMTFCYVVGFKSGEFELWLNGGEETPLFIANATECEVIGNVHDSPELIEE